VPVETGGTQGEGSQPDAPPALQTAQTMQIAEMVQLVPLEGLLEALLLVDINGQRLGVTAIFLRDRSGMLYASVEDLARWRVRVPSVQPVVQRGQRTCLWRLFPGCSTGSTRRPNPWPWKFPRRSSPERR